MEDDEQEEPEAEREEGKEKKGNRIRPRERYRALIDIMDEEQALIAMGDRKARFALVILAAFNAAIIVGGALAYNRYAADLPGFLKIVYVMMMLAYGLTAIYFLLLAIDALRPRKAPVASKDLSTGTHDSAGVRFFLEISKHRKDDYWEQIREMDYERLNRELAYQIHGLATLISAKYDALEHLYRGMRILTLGAAALIVAVAGSGTAMVIFK